MTARILQTQPLTDAVPWRASLAANCAVEQSLPPHLKQRIVALTITLAVLGLSILFVFGFFLTLVLDGGRHIDTALVTMLVPPLVFPAFLLIWVIFLWVRYVRLARRRWRLDHFATANGWTYRAHSAQVPRSGIIFSGLGSADILDRIDAMPSLGAVLGRLRHQTGSGRSRTIVLVDFVEVPLPFVLPHLLLDARANDKLFGRSNLDLDLRTDQRLDLEGNFPDAFRLYCPRGYEADATYLLTPDVMAVLLDNAREFDIEFVDDRLFLYSPGGIVTTDPQRWEALCTTIDTLRAKTESWSRWRDDRLDTAAGVRPFSDRPQGVAPPGQRLRRKSGWLWAVAAVLILGFGLYSLVEDIFGF